jgi:DNA polymerase-3 subunit chi
MTQIDFYTNVVDKIQTALRIVAKAYGRGHSMLICCADAQTAQHIDRMLWTTPAVGFIPHCNSDDPLAKVTPVIIDHRGAEPFHDQLLLNLRAEWPAFFGRFERLVEIVSIEETDRRSARERFKFYRDRGYAIRTHDLAAAADTAPGRDEGRG